jgi:hypothetical protein
MNDAFLLLTPLLMLPVVALLGFVGCDKLLGLQPIPPKQQGPTNLIAMAGNGRVDLKWDPYTNATEYYVKRGEVSADYAMPSTPVSAQRQTYADMDVVNGTTYYYAVTARVSNDETQDSNEATATPMASPNTTDYFVESYTLGTLLNTVSIWGGMEILVGANSLEIHAVGRVFAAGNYQQHAIKIIDKTAGVDLTTVLIETIGGTAGEMQTAPVLNQVILNKNSPYYIVSKEMAGADAFYQDDTTVTTRPVATVVQAVKGDDATPWVPATPGNHCFGPLTFQYTIIP